ncbi:MAG: CPBP family intramembrane metalloprotease, partial [Desulfobacterales bacterium]|nr:CPBP family intramembrane metalloprotease [Desulfobacterales bacterium]
FFHPFLRNSTAEALSLYKYVFSHAGSFLVLFVVPLLFLVILNRFSSDRFSPLKYTFTLGDFRLGWKLVVLFVGICFAFHVALAPSGIYPVCKSGLIRQSIAFFLLFEFFQCLYMIGFEYFFRGYILIEASRIFGPNALAITLLPYIIMKFGKPPFEIYTAILVGLALGYMTIRTRSFWYAAGAHALLATMVDTWEYYGMVSGQ